MYEDRSPESAPPSPAGGQPPLGILHLLVWTLGSALMFSLLRQSDGAELRPVSWGRSLVYLFYGLVYGGALGSLLLPPWRWWRRGVPFPEAPGHWLLLTNGLIALLLGLSLFLLPRPATTRVDLWLHAASTAAPAVLYLWGALAPRGGTAWALVLALLGTLHLLQALCLVLLAGTRPGGIELMAYDLFRLLQSYGTLAAGLLVIVASLADVYRRVGRDWLHWAGAFVELATIVWITFGVFGGLPVFL